MHRPRLRRVQTRLLGRRCSRSGRDSSSCTQRRSRLHCHLLQPPPLRVRLPPLVPLPRPLLLQQPLPLLLLPCRWHSRRVPPLRASSVIGSMLSSTNGSRNSRMCASWDWRITATHATATVCCRRCTTARNFAVTCSAGSTIPIRAHPVEDGNASSRRKTATPHCCSLSRRYFRACRRTNRGVDSWVRVISSRA